MSWERCLQQEVIEWESSSRSGCKKCAKIKVPLRQHFTPFHPNLFSLETRTPIGLLYTSRKVEGRHRSKARDFAYLHYDTSRDHRKLALWRGFQRRWFTNSIFHDRWWKIRYWWFMHSALGFETQWNKSQTLIYQQSAMNSEVGKSINVTELLLFSFWIGLIIGIGHQSKSSIFMILGNCLSGVKR